MNDNLKSGSSKWKKEYSIVLVANFIYIVIFYFLMQIYT